MVVTLVRILIVEDDPQTRATLQDNVASVSDFEVVDAVGSVAEALEALDHPVEVLLVDLGLPDGSGESVIRHAAGLSPAPEIMVVTVFGDEHHVINAIEAGASGYLLKDAHPQAIGEAVRELLNGGSPITPVIARHILKRFNASPAPEPAADATADEPRLTPREQEVLSLVSRGYTNSEIARLLTMSFHTVTSHIKHIYKKLSVRSRSEAIFEASQLGLIDIHKK